MSYIKDKKAILFDFGDTLASTVPTYPDRIRIALNELDFKFTEKEYFSAFQYADFIIYKEYLNDSLITSSIYQKKLVSIILDELGIDMDTDEAWSQIRINMSKTEYSRILLPGAKELLSGLRESGYRLGIVSNNDGKTAEKCEQVGIAEYFKIIIDSTNVKLIKPDKNIFLLASQKLGTEPKDMLHIGDLYGADILGAMNAGIETIWINRKDGIDYEEINVLQARDLLELSELLELS